MSLYQTIQLGRITLREDFAVSESSDGTTRKLSLTGRESMGALGQRTRIQVEQRRNDLLSMPGDMIPLVFTEKPDLNGFYVVESSSGKLTERDNYWAILDWQADLARVGVAPEIDFESRLSGSVTRLNDFSATGSRYHAPAVNAKAYWAGSTTPIYIDRTGSEGTVRVYEAIATGVNPRWGALPTDYVKGRCRFLDDNDLERVGTSIRTNGADWELGNSVVRLRPGTGYAFDLLIWNGSGWTTEDWDLLYGTSPVSVGTFDYVSVLDNEFESVTIRLTKDLVPGRMTVDLTLKRGMTIVQMYVEHEFSTTLTLKRASTVIGTSGTGYITQTTADSSGFKSILGSARTFTGNAPTSAITKTSTATLDAFFGASLNATAGNAPADIYAQYLGMPAEYVRGVRR
jgi:hypothetical protein